MKVLLAIVVIVGLGTVAATIIVGTHLFDGTVVSDPYETGLRWDIQQRSRAESGWILAFREHSVQAGTDDLVLTITDRTGKPLLNAEVDIRLTRPFTALQDLIVHAAPSHDASYRVRMPLSEPGRWDAFVTVRKDGSEVLFEEPLQVLSAKSNAR